ncbi:MAG: NBR1-Ig-like domain-containing protein [Pedococcus sp.]
MGDRTATTRAKAIEGFAATLCDLRESVGRPSFRVMAGRSRAISHTTLHEAVHGNRLPSWATTAEFVKACGADPVLYRDRWDRANQAVAEVTPGVSQPTPASSPAEVVPGDPQPPRWHPDRRALVGAAAALITAGTGLAAAWSAHGEAGPPPAAAHGPIAADCPVHPQNPPAAPPAHQGDRATFVADVTLDDCSHVPAGRALPKVWRFKNAGSVPWVGYSLHRVDLPQERGQCQTITDVPVPDTAPGQVVDVTVEVSFPEAATFCLVRFKLTDATGKVAFPGNRPVNFQVVVDPPQHPEAGVLGSGT